MGTLYGLLRWHLGVGDPTFIGWFTFAAYFVAAGVCARAAQASRRAATALSARATPGSRVEQERTMAWLWALCAAVMAGLGANKQADLQTLFLEQAKDAALRQGWYEHRHTYKVLFIIGLVSSGCVVAALLGHWLRRVWARAAAPLAGLAVLFAFVLMRASLMEHVGLLFGGLLGDRLAWLFELSGIGLITWSAWRAPRGAPAVEARA
jgi:hypothetical protein